MVKPNEHHITITPPLAVISPWAEGYLVGLNSRSLLIDWKTEAALDSGTIEVSLPSGSRISLDVLQDDKQYVATSRESQALLVDLLHQIRKEQHINLCAHQDVEHSERRNGFEDIKLPQLALPQTAWSEVSTAQDFLGRRFAAPFLITGMTGGVEQATVINRRLAAAAATLGIPMGVGSQRLALENSRHSGIFTLKDRHPSLFLIGNIGIGQLRSIDFLDLCKRAVAMINADALAIHVNVLQELIQVEGDRDFRGVIGRIGQVASHIKLPVIVKEVGAGLDPSTIKRLYDVGVRCFDVGGTGGTSWAFIEGQRSTSPRIQRLGQTFRNWGISTAEALQQAVDLKLPDASLIATGGIRDGLTALKAIRQGAKMVGLGLPLFKAALKSDDGPLDELNTFITELKIAMMCSGTRFTD